MNLTALESSLRFFLLKANGETFVAPKPGDADVPLTHMTNFASLGWLITEYNAKLNAEESEGFALDESSVHVRDALAHGRLTSPSREFPLTLWKFGRVKSGHVPIEYTIRCLRLSGSMRLGKKYIGKKSWWMRAANDAAIQLPHPFASAHMVT
jgi:hypothetical protein